MLLAAFEVDYLYFLFMFPLHAFELHQQGAPDQYTSNHDAKQEQ